MLFILFAKQSTVNEFAFAGQKVDREFHLNVFEKFLNRISRVGPQFREKVKCFLLHDNAPAHSVVIVKRF